MHYQYTLELLSEDGRQLDQVVLAPDWAPALEWTRFEAIREGRLPPVLGPVAGAVEPVWDGRAGEPAVAAFRAVVPVDGGGQVAREIPRTYVRGVVQQATAALVARGVLAAGDHFRWVVNAFPSECGPAGSATAPGDFAVEEIVQPLPLTDARLSDFLGGSVLHGPAVEGAHVPVFVPRAVLDETLDLARRAGDVETGGVLVGTLRRDSGAATGVAPELFVEVTAQIAAPHTRSESHKLTFTSDTWAAVQAALALRRRREVMLGWWHFHPDFCRLRECPLERRRHCTAASPFFSAEDVHLHATCFPAAYHVALLISDSAAGLASSLFGWSQGMVAARPFHLFDPTPQAKGEFHAADAAPLP